MKSYYLTNDVLPERPLFHYFSGFTWIATFNKVIYPNHRNLVAIIDELWRTLSGGDWGKCIIFVYSVQVAQNWHRQSNFIKYCQGYMQIFNERPKNSLKPSKLSNYSVYKAPEINQWSHHYKRVYKTKQYIWNIFLWGFYMANMAMFTLEVMSLIRTYYIFFSNFIQKQEGLRIKRKEKKLDGDCKLSESVNQSELRITFDQLWRIRF